jgi:hypothetical protein
LKLINNINLFLGDKVLYNESIEKSLKSDVEKFLPEVSINSFNIVDNEDGTINENKITVFVEFRIKTDVLSKSETIEIEF